MIMPLFVGNALKLYLSPPANADYWRIMRKGTDDISGPDDTGAIAIYEGDLNSVTDTNALLNDARMYYAVYYWINDAWVFGNSNYGTPTASYVDYSTDVMGILRDRLEAGLAVEVARKTLLNDFGYIQVLTAPPVMNANIGFPLVTLSLEDENPEIESIGLDISGSYDDDEESLEMVGQYNKVRLSITGWSLNPDERLALRKAIRRIVLANADIFAANGMMLPELSLRNVDAVNGEYGDTPLFLVSGDFSCTAPVRVGASNNALILDVTVTVEASNG